MLRIARSLFIILLFLLVLPATGQQHGILIKNQEITSHVLKENVKYSVYLPPSYTKEKSNTCSILYLLHGYGGNQNSWIVDKILDSLYNRGFNTSYIVVMPNGKNTYFINDYQENYPYESFFIKEFMPYVMQQYNPDTTEKPVICGLSMGGFGAVILAAKHPKMFSASISLSGAMRSPEIFMNLPQKKYQKNFAHIYGDSLSGAARITEHWKQNSPYFVIDSSSADDLKHINWYIECGSQDFLFPANESFHQLLVKYSVPHEYHIRAGAHNWMFWRQGFINAMNYLDKTNRKP